MATTIALFVLWRSERANKFFRLETEQNLSTNQSALITKTINDAPSGINQGLSPSQLTMTMNSVRSTNGLNENKYRSPGIGHEQFFIST